MAKTTSYRLKQVFKDGKVRRTELEAEMVAKLEEFHVSANAKKAALTAIRRHLDEIEGEAQFLQDLCDNAKTGIWDSTKSKKWFVGRNFQEWGSCVKAEPKNIIIADGKSKIAITIDHIIGLDLNRFFLAPFREDGKSGCIPASIANLKYITSLDMCFNFLVGSIPTNIYKLAGLKTLKLEFNQLNGKIPSNFKKLTNLTYLALDHNRFEGNISMLASLTNLTYLNIHENKLSLSKTTMETLAGFEHLDHCWFYNNSSYTPEPGSKVEYNIQHKDWKAKE